MQGTTPQVVYTVQSHLTNTFSSILATTFSGANVELTNAGWPSVWVKAMGCSDKGVMEHIEKRHTCGDTLVMSMAFLDDVLQAGLYKKRGKTKWWGPVSFYANCDRLYKCYEIQDENTVYTTINGRMRLFDLVWGFEASEKDLFLCLGSDYRMKVHPGLVLPYSTCSHFHVWFQNSKGEFIPKVKYHGVDIMYSELIKFGNISIPL